MPAIDYAYDPTGELAANYIDNEVHVVDVSTDRSVFPHHAPFYDESYNLVVNGRKSGSAWVELMPNVDFQFSPMFIEASAKTGKRVFSYIVLVTEWDEIKLEYRAVGTYTDSELIAQVQASSIDRSLIYEWSKIYGDAVSYHPRVRDPDVIDKDPYEIINIGLQRILEALENPNSSTVVTTADITNMEQKIANAATKDDVNNNYKEHTQAPVTTGQDVTANVITEPLSSGVCGTFILAFVADDGRVQITNANFARNGNIVDQTIIGETFTDDELFTFEVSTQASSIVVDATPNTSGKFTAKVVYLA